MVRVRERCWYRGHRPTLPAFALGGSSERPETEPVYLLTAELALSTAPHLVGHLNVWMEGVEEGEQLNAQETLVWCIDDDYSSLLELRESRTLPLGFPPARAGLAQVGHGTVRYRLPYGCPDGVLEGQLGGIERARVPLPTHTVPDVAIARLIPRLPLQKGVVAALNVLDTHHGIVAEDHWITYTGEERGDGQPPDSLLHRFDVSTGASYWTDDQHRVVRMRLDGRKMERLTVDEVRWAFSDSSWHFVSELMVSEHLVPTASHVQPSAARLQPTRYCLLTRMPARGIEYVYARQEPAGGDGALTVVHEHATKIIGMSRSTTKTVLECRPDAYLTVERITWSLEEPAPGLGPYMRDIERRIPYGHSDGRLAGTQKAARFMPPPGLFPAIPAHAVHELVLPLIVTRLPFEKGTVFEFGLLREGHVSPGGIPRLCVSGCAIEYVGQGGSEMLHEFRLVHPSLPTRSYWLDAKRRLVRVEEDGLPAAVAVSVEEARAAVRQLAEQDPHPDTHVEELIESTRRLFEEDRRRKKPSQQ